MLSSFTPNVNVLKFLYLTCINKMTIYFRNKPDGVDTDHILMLMSYLVQILYFQYDYTNKTYYDELRVLLNMNNLTAHEVMFRIRPECKELLRSCSWKSRNWRCDSLFEEVTSIEGLCCGTNYYGLKNRMFSG